jgi:hypothetical protein
MPLFQQSCKMQRSISFQSTDFCHGNCVNGNGWTQEELFLTYIIGLTNIVVFIKTPYKASIVLPTCTFLIFVIFYGLRGGNLCCNIILWVRRQQYICVFTLIIVSWKFSCLFLHLFSPFVTTHIRLPIRETKTFFSSLMRINIVLIRTNAYMQSQIGRTHNT